MKYTLCILLLGVCLSFNHGQDLLSAPKNSLEYLKPLKRVARQEMPQLPDGMPPPPQNFPTPLNMMQLDTFSRKKRDAKGVGGSLPTRKG